jgi:hypothetical protein
MRLKLKHLLHPLRTANAAKTLVAARLNMRKLAVRGEPRFDLLIIPQPRQEGGTLS